MRLLLRKAWKVATNSINGGNGQDGRFGAGLGREINAGDWDVGDLTWEDFDLAVTDVSW